MAKDKKMPKMDLVDIGGGFSTSTNETHHTKAHNFEVIAPQIQDYMQNVFPGKHNKDIVTIAEPGRQICQESQTICVQIFLAKQQGEVRHYYIKNGVYQGFGSQVIENEKFEGQPILPKEELR